MERGLYCSEGFKEKRKRGWHRGKGKKRTKQNNRTHYSQGNKKKITQTTKKGNKKNNKKKKPEKKKGWALGQTGKRKTGCLRTSRC